MDVESGHLAISFEAATAQSPRMLILFDVKGERSDGFLWAIRIDDVTWAAAQHRWIPLCTEKKNKFIVKVV